MEALNDYLPTLLVLSVFGFFHVVAPVLFATLKTILDPAFEFYIWFQNRVEETKRARDLARQETAKLRSGLTEKQLARSA